MKNKNLESFIDKVTENITEDRAATKTLLLSLMQYMQTGDDRHREFGLIAAKYLETLQRSNEQLVKVSALLQKKISSGKDLSSFDKDEIFKLIQAEPDGNLDG